MSSIFIHLLIFFREHIYCISGKINTVLTFWPGEAYEILLSGLCDRIKWNVIVWISEWKQEEYFFRMLDFLFLLWFDDSFYFVSLNIFTWFNDICDVTMNLSIAVTFFSEYDKTLNLSLSMGKYTWNIGWILSTFDDLFKSFLKPLANF